MHIYPLYFEGFLFICLHIIYNMKVNRKTILYFLFLNKKYLLLTNEFKTRKMLTVILQRYIDYCY